MHCRMAWAGMRNRASRVFRRSPLDTGLPIMAPGVPATSSCSSTTTSAAPGRRDATGHRPAESPIPRTGRFAQPCWPASPADQSRGPAAAAPAAGIDFPSLAAGHQPERAALRRQSGRCLERERRARAGELDRGRRFGERPHDETGLQRSRYDPQRATACRAELDGERQRDGVGARCAEGGGRAASEPMA